MRALFLAAAVFFAVSGGAIAQTTETATCKDGTTATITTHRGACSRHGGVASYAPVAIAPTATTSTPPVPAPATPTTAEVPPRATPGGGVGQVWVNTASKVYHCQGDRYYGKTKKGSYMTEAAAKAAGDRPDHGKACSS